jgi:lipoic acid synthetase
MTTPKHFIPVFDHSQQSNISRMPDWIRQNLTVNPLYSKTANTLKKTVLHTVCEAARCPNRGECWSRGTATFMLLGDICTRACGFCAVKTGKPNALNSKEVADLIETVKQLELAYVVLTSVNRDDLVTGGAEVFAQCLSKLRKYRSDIGLEVLTPDFYRCLSPAMEILFDAVHNTPFTRLDGVRLVWGHNVETVPRLYSQVRKGSQYQRSLDLLNQVSHLQNIEGKSALMLGLGETQQEVRAVLQDLQNCGVKRLVLGQYLRPTRYHLPVKEYISPEQFVEYAQAAKEIGFQWVKSGALVRSSYHAET